MDRYLATPRWVYWSLFGATAYTLVGEGYGLVELLSRRDEIAQNPARSPRCPYVHATVFHHGQPVGSMVLVLPPRSGRFTGHGVVGGAVLRCDRDCDGAEHAGQRLVLSRFLHHWLSSLGTSVPGVCDLGTGALI